MEAELIKALKQLTKECYNNKCQHSNSKMRDAMENPETVLIKIKDNVRSI